MTKKEKVQVYKIIWTNMYYIDNSYMHQKSSFWSVLQAF